MRGKMFRIFLVNALIGFFVLSFIFLVNVPMADAGREMDGLWARCEFWELTPLVCETACQVAPTKPLRTLDALHLATYLLARRRIEDLELLTADQRLEEAARGV